MKAVPRSPAVVLLAMTKYGVSLSTATAEFEEELGGRL
jgi:hypothetical protein